MHVGIVDPGDANAVLSAIEEENFSRPESSQLKLSALLATHHHADHTGGIAQLVSAFPDLTVVGGTRDGIKYANMLVAEGDVVSVGQVQVSVLDTPCHTNGSVCFLINNQALFTGDFLFAAGAGRFFEGNAKDMVTSLEKLNRLPNETLMFCGHEYTLSNLTFANRVLPNHIRIKERLDWAKTQRDDQRPTIPSSLGVERQTNVFLMCQESELSQRVKELCLARPSLVVGSGSDVGKDARITSDSAAQSVFRVMAALRTLKDVGLQ